MTELHDITRAVGMLSGQPQVALQKRCSGGTSSMLLQGFQASGWCDWIYQCQMAGYIQELNPRPTCQSRGGHDIWGKLVVRKYFCCNNLLLELAVLRAFTINFTKTRKGKAWQWLKRKIQVPDAACSLRSWRVDVL
ncbi:unnamed protein product [Prunus armeniaca]|uniref:Uncharacterized protein n=1 Tax=Prunus armeniaca TaxID=36596 RepID=A0A6J5YAF6_PRUAR|nr:unnamed protein product [Prunus armeniaca]